MQTTKRIAADPFDPATPEFIQDPYPSYKNLRENNPVVFNEARGYWVLSKYEDVVQVLKDKRYAKGMGGRPHVCTRVKSFLGKLVPTPVKTALFGLPPAGAHWFNRTDSAEHLRLRAWISKSFQPNQIRSLRSKIENNCIKLIDAHRADGGFDVISDFALPLPFSIISDIIGLPDENRNKILAWTKEIVGVIKETPSPEQLKSASEANSEFQKCLLPLIKTKRKNPQEDLISSLLTVQPDGLRMDPNHVIANAIFLTMSGYETTTGLIANGLLHLLRHPEQLELLRKNPELLESAVEEILRYDAPAAFARYMAVEPITVKGHDLKPGDSVYAILASANRDADAFANPDRFDITRRNNNHLSFGAGVHFCIGASLARLETQISIDTILRAAPSLRLATDEIHYASLRPRTPERMPVYF